MAEYLQSYAEALQERLEPFPEDEMWDSTDPENDGEDSNSEGTDVLQVSELCLRWPARRMGPNRPSLAFSKIRFQNIGLYRFVPSPIHFCRLQIGVFF